MRAFIAATIAIALAACWQRPGDAAFTDSKTGYSVRVQLQFFDGKGMDILKGERGRVNPVVLEYVLAAPDGPLARYYDLVLALPQKPSTVASDLEALGGAAHAISRKPNGADYARALARKLVPSVNDALASGNPAGKVSGTATLYWGEPADLDRGRLKDPYEAVMGPGSGTSTKPRLTTVVARFASVNLVFVGCDGTLNYHLWDVSELPEAFDPDATLDPARVAAKIRPLHPAVPR